MSLATRAQTNSNGIQMSIARHLTGGELSRLRTDRSNAVLGAEQGLELGS